MNLDLLYDNAKNQQAIDLIDAEIIAINNTKYDYREGFLRPLKKETRLLELEGKKKKLLENRTPNKFIAVRIENYGLIIVGVSSGNVFYGEYESSTGMYRLFRNKTKVFKHKGV